MASLSEGEQKRLLLDYLLASKPDYLILDNLFDSLDLAGQQMIEQRLHQLQHQIPLVQLLSRRRDKLAFIHSQFRLQNKQLVPDEGVSAALPELTGEIPPAADQPALCDFYLGSIVNKGSLKIAISTNGKSPVLARRLREYFTEVIPDNIEESIEVLNTFRSQHKGDFQEKLSDLNKVTASFQKSNEPKKYKRLAFTLASSFLMFFIGYGCSTLVSFSDIQNGLSLIPNEFYYMLLIGFVAQLIDGAVGLGYGVTCATSMMILGVKLPAISGSIHTAEMFSSAISGFSHYKFGNVNKRLLFWLTSFGVVGAVLGALFLVYLGNEYENFAYLVLSAYTFVIGVRLLVIAFKKIQMKKKIKFLGVLGFTGGFMDAFGGGGWGPIVTSTLLGRGRNPRYTIGSVNAAEFAVSFASGVTFMLFGGIEGWQVIIGLILGGVIAAPIAAILVNKIKRQPMMIAVGILIIILSLRTLSKLL